MMTFPCPAYPPGDHDIYVTKFAEYATGAQPFDWSSRYGGGFTATVEAVAGSLSGKALRWTKTASGRQGLSWDRVPLAADVDILVRFRAIEAWAISEMFINAAARGRGDAGAETCYQARHYGDATNSRWVGDFGMFNAGTTSNLGNNNYGPSPNYVVNEWAWGRFNLAGTTLRRKLWHSAASEPASWTETITNTTIAGAGWCGLLNSGAANPNVEIDYFGVGLNGKTVPVPGV